MTTTIDTAAAARRRTAVVAVLRRTSARVAALSLAAMLATGGVAPILAQSADDGFTTAATGLVVMGGSDTRWLLATMSIEDGDEVALPGVGAAGFLLADRGAVLVADDDGRETLLEPGDARFVAAADDLTLRAIDGDADLWRVAVATGSAGDPMEDGDGIVGETLVAMSEGADDADEDARRKVSLRIGVLEDGDSATAGGDDETVLYVLALDGDLVLGDGEDLREGDIVEEPEADRDGSVDVEADGDAVVAYIAIGPALDPETLTEGGTRAGQEDDDDGSSGGGTGGGTAPTSVPTEPDPEPEPVDPEPEPVDPGPDGGSDEDGDGLSLAIEIQLGTDPTVADTDNDGLSDGEEVNDVGTSPLTGDTDADQLMDIVEVANCYDPLNPNTDNDLELDALEFATRGSNCTAPTPVDTDGDGLSDDEEATLGTNPQSPDTDSDQLADGVEVANCFSPLTNDTDNDTEPDPVEFATGGSNC